MSKGKAWHDPEPLPHHNRQTGISSQIPDHRAAVDGVATSRKGCARRWGREGGATPNSTCTCLNSRAEADDISEYTQVLMGGGDRSLCTRGIRHNKAPQSPFNVHTKGFKGPDRPRCPNRGPGHVFVHARTLKTQPKGHRHGSWHKPIRLCQSLRFPTPCSSGQSESSRDDSVADPLSCRVCTDPEDGS